MSIARKRNGLKLVVPVQPAKRIGGLLPVPVSNLGQYLYEGKVENGEPFNFGPRAEQTKTVFQLVQDLAELWGLDRNTAARLTGNVPFEEATLLKLNCDKALAYLDWHSTLHYEECVHFIADWYKAFYTDANVDMYSLTTAQIE